jgi:hypothetical protein
MTRTRDGLKQGKIISLTLYCFLFYSLREIYVLLLSSLYVIPLSLKKGPFM